MPPTTCSRSRRKEVPPRELAQPIVPGLPDLLAEVALAARREQARSIGDVLLRRTRLGLLAARELGGVGNPIKRVAGVLARELGWDDARTEREIERFAAEADAEGNRPAASLAGAGSGGEPRRLRPRSPPRESSRTVQTA